MPEDIRLPRLRVSDNRHFLVTEGGQPFFWLGDTAWELFHRLSREDAALYLDNRRAKGFNVIQAVILAERDGLRVGNVYGERPLIDNDPARPNDAYFAHVDAVIGMAADRGMYIGLLPTWGDKVDLVGGEGPVIFDAPSARLFGRYVGERYRRVSNIVWILGGDRYGEGFEDVWTAMAEGIREGADGAALMTYHPRGPGDSAHVFHNAPWLDFNMLQSGHAEQDVPNWEWIARDWMRKPTKPVFDGEPNYEDIPINFNSRYGFFTTHDVRKAAYRSVFSGAFGHTYGHNSVWQMAEPQYVGLIDPIMTWRAALDRPAACQMIHLRRLMESRPFLNRIPDQSLLVMEDMARPRVARATRADDGSYAMVYVPNASQTVEVVVDRLHGEHRRAWWYDPRTGECTSLGAFGVAGWQGFTTPDHGPDWVLVLDAQDFPAPGQM